MTGPGIALGQMLQPHRATYVQIAASLALAGGVLVLLGLLGGLTPAGIWQMIRQVPPWVYGPIALAHSVTIFLSGWKWRLILSGSGGNAPAHRDAVAATTLGILGGQVLPTQLATPMARAWVGRRHGISTGRSVGTSMLEQVFEVIVLAAMALVGLGAHLADLGLVASGILALSVAALMTACVRPGLALVGRSLAALARLFALAGRLADGFMAAARLPHRVLFALVGMSFVRYGLLAAMNVAVLLILVPETSPTVLFAAYPAVLLATAIPIFPGGLGAVELTWAGVLIAAGLAAGEAGEAAIAIRIILTSGFLAIAPLLLALRTRQGGAA